RVDALLPHRPPHPTLPPPPRGSPLPVRSAILFTNPKLPPPHPPTVASPRRRVCRSHRLAVAVAAASPSPCRCQRLLVAATPSSSTKKPDPGGTHPSAPALSPFHSSSPMETETLAARELVWAREEEMMPPLDGSTIFILPSTSAAPPPPRRTISLPSFSFDLDAHAVIWPIRSATYSSGGLFLRAWLHLPPCTPQLDGHASSSTPAMVLRGKQFNYKEHVEREKWRKIEESC
ncbi:unnamed protein product, partial [Urochloa humidicola]